MSNPIVINPAEVIAMEEPRCGALHPTIVRRCYFQDGHPGKHMSVAGEWSDEDMGQRERINRAHGYDGPPLCSNGNQQALNNGCVCDSDCDSCARLAESWEAMRQVALAVVSYDNFVNTFPQNRFSVASAQAIIERYENMRDKARAALALAARVKESKHDAD